MNWVKKKTGPGIYNLTTVGEAEQILTAESTVVLGFLDSLVVFPQSQLRLLSLLMVLWFDC